jgi:acetate---CoA ligase (ADP-forming)
MPRDLSPLLSPCSIAIVGASPRPDSFGAGLLRTIAGGGYGGAVHLVNPRYDTIGDRPCHASVAANPGRVDCAAFVLGDALLVDAVRSAAVAGVKGAVIFGRAQGAEPDGTPRVEAIRAIAREAGMSICGANCMGFLNLHDRLQLAGAPFTALPAPSGVALVSHSGSSWSGLVGNRRQMGFDIAVSAGQELATTAADYIHHLLDHAPVRVIACVMETIRDPANFIAAAERAAAKGVAIVVLKLGRSEAGRHFAISHSGALSGSNAAYDAVFARYGVVQVRGLDELLDTAELLALDRPMAAPGIALGSDSGGERQLVADLAADIGLGFAPLTPETLAAVQSHLDPGMEATNPLDYWGDGGDVMAPVLTAMAEDPGVGVVVMATNMTADRTFTEMSVAAIRKVREATDKPVVVMGNSATTFSPTVAADLRARGIAVLMGTASGLAALAHLQRVRFPVPRTGTADPLPLPETARAVLEAAGHSLRGAEGFAILQSAGIPCTPFAEVRCPGDIATFAAHHGLPVALKIDAAEVAHKSEFGGVALDLRTLAQANAALATLRQRHPDAPVIVQAMADGVELILGMTTDPDFGPIVTLGLGGVFTEVFRDSTTLLPPFTGTEARAALARLRGFPLLTGARGRPPVDLDALCALVARFGTLVAGASDRLAEIEINPVMAGPDGALAVDCIARQHEDRP